ncbi:hypothetical protein AJ79_09700 [Helicocarpus griseus UAMH5409]|uniref:Myb-like domain-containing protein n=1 Tax=Helicocarpus griseus UAMH5409 TaxID=1447875 RepID=A0A2B7WHW8_9EURO|nr:hypothetical protein AJ79_09700 [Helicocarpus griseus UAMH5409]
MSRKLYAYDRRDVYYPEEESLLQQLKLSHPSTTWQQLRILFNDSVPSNRQRTEDGLKNKWKDMENCRKEEKLLRELKLTHPEAGWQEVACLFNQIVPAHRNRRAETLKAKWENIQHRKHEAELSFREPLRSQLLVRPSPRLSMNPRNDKKELQAGSSRKPEVGLKSDPAVEVEVKAGGDHCAALESEPWFRELYDSIDSDTASDCLIDPALGDMSDVDISDTFA